ncbi:CinA family protein [Nocardia sp. NPDC024068]|uniref:CinA family protein n=1 Tax=Nocardia sp. NPDC024068 TaxID=3157197 RepID=UPI0033C1F0CA
MIAERALRRGVGIAVAESLTAGNLAAALGAAPDSGEWFVGGVVAYTKQAKRRVLRVPDVPVVSERAAEAMARGVRELLAADIAVAVTGVGGPGPQDGEPAGSVWFAAATSSGATTWHHLLTGDPPRILDDTVTCALEKLAELVGAPLPP